MIYAAVLGYGTVGSGVVEVITKNKDVIAKNTGDEISVKYILDLREFPGDPNEDKVVHDFDVILNDPDVKIVVETMGGIEPGYTYSKNALLKGKSVCTSNKELVANKGPELIKIAAENNCNYMFEASVGGGIPLIRTLNNALTAEKIDSITGILNGTTNYMLTRMDNEGIDYDSVLEEAQANGYAERNPAADVEGYDACRKIAILSSLCYGKTVRFEDIYTEGITKITDADFKYAKALNRSIKLLTMFKDIDGSCFAMVAPFMISENNPLYSVRDVFNACLVHGNMVDYTMYYGRGAGKLPTASAVVGDVVECAKNIGKNLPVFWKDEIVNLVPVEKHVCKFFVRVSDLSEKAKALQVFEGAEIVEGADVSGEFAFVTGAMSEKEFIDKISGLSGVLTRIRLED